jgi:hypothetical protein
MWRGGFLAHGVYLRQPEAQNFSGFNSHAGFPMPMRDAHGMHFRWQALPHMKISNLVEGRQPKHTPARETLDGCAGFLEYTHTSTQCSGTVDSPRSPLCDLIQGELDLLFTKVAMSPWQ